MILSTRNAVGRRSRMLVATKRRDLSTDRDSWHIETLRDHDTVPRSRGGTDR